jgi:outer membrane lipopolysaccharide assembly protein LptE/RlpB
MAADHDTPQAELFDDREQVASQLLRRILAVRPAAVAMTALIRRRA